MGSSQAPAPGGLAPCLRRARYPSSTSVAAAAASTANGYTALDGPVASADQNSPPSGMRDRLSRFGTVSSCLKNGSRGPAGDIRARAAYHLSVTTPDLIARCVVDGGHARAVVVTTTGVAREAARRHAATGAAEVALARGLTSGLLLATLTKDEERITLQVLGDGPLGGITVDARVG